MVYHDVCFRELLHFFLSQKIVKNPNKPLFQHILFPSLTKFLKISLFQVIFSTLFHIYLYLNCWNEIWVDYVVYLKILLLYIDSCVHLFNWYIWMVRERYICVWDNVSLLFHSWTAWNWMTLTYYINVCNFCYHFFTFIANSYYFITIYHLSLLLICPILKKSDNYDQG